MKRTAGHGENSIRWKFTSKLDALEFADDLVLIFSTKQQIEDKTARMDDEARRVGLKINMEKTTIQVMRINAKEPGTDYDSWTRNSRSG